MEQRQHPQDRLLASSTTATASSGIGQGSMATDGVAEVRPLRHRRHRLLGRRRLGGGADHPLQRPGPVLRRQPADRRRLTRTTTAAGWRASATTPRRSAASASPSPTARTCCPATTTSATSTSTTSRSTTRASSRRSRSRAGIGYYADDEDADDLGRLRLGAAHADRHQRHLRRRHPGLRRRQRHLLVRQARPAARVRRLGRQRGGDRLLLRRRHLPDRRRPALRRRRRPGPRRGRQSGDRRHHQLRERLLGPVAGAEHRRLEHRALAHLAQLRLLRRLRELRGRPGDLRRRPLPLLIGQSALAAAQQGRYIPSDPQAPARADAVAQWGLGPGTASKQSVFVTCA